MNDHILTALINLFALFSAGADNEESDKQSARQSVENYLIHFFGIHNRAGYMDIYDTLCDTYELTQPDLAEQVRKILSQLKNRIPHKEQVKVMLRFMEFCLADGVISNDEQLMIDAIASEFGVTDDETADCFDFVNGRKGKNVGVAQVEALNGQLRVLRIHSLNLVLVAYDGDEVVKMNGIQMLKGCYVPWPKNGIIASAQGAPVYYRFVQSLFGEDKKQTYMEMRGDHLEFRFPGSDNGLHNFTFTLRSGEFVAIMGGSGAGKTTLMSILNGSMAPQKGSLTINGRPLYGETDELKKYIGFVPQDDLLIAELTVYQNLYYTARFCFDNMSEREICERVDKTLSDLDLVHIKDLKVGSPLKKTISGGQRKRLNIALELIRHPSILFLDEPTSGLSSADSEKVIHLLKEQTYRGRMVVVNIHQPSSDIYKLFDRLWILDAGGYPIYDGNPIEAPSVFKTVANYAEAETSICQYCGNINPEVMFEIIDDRRLDNDGHKTEVRKIRPQEWHEMHLERAAEQIAQQDQHAAERTDIPKTSQRRPGWFKQLYIYLERNVKAKLTDRQFLAIALLEAPMLALIVGALTRYAGDNGYTVFDNKNLLSYFFMAIIVSIFLGMSICAEEIFKDKLLLKRERFLQLSHSAYITSKIVQTAVIVAVQSLLFLLVGNTMLGLSDLWLEWWLVLFATGLLSGIIGLLLSQSLSSIVAIYITIPILLIPQILLCGVVVTFDDLNPHSQTRNVPFIGEVIPSRWAYEAIAVTVFGQNDYSRHFFQDQAAQYELQLARMGTLDELKKIATQTKYLRQNEQERTDNLALLRYETVQMATQWNVPAFDLMEQLTPERFTASTCESYKAWVDRSDNLLYRRSLQYTNAIDRLKQDMIREHGADYLNELKLRHCNKMLENTLLNTSSEKLVRREGERLVPQVGTAYLTPANRFGRAPFYSSWKMLGDNAIRTLWFNLGVLLAMAIVVAILLYSRLPWKE